MDKYLFNFLADNEKEWRKHMLKEIGTIKEEQFRQGKSIEKLKVISGFWGAFGGILVASAAYLKTKFSL